MPRPWEIPVQPYDDLTENDSYPAKVVSVSRSKKPAGIEVVIEHLDEKQRGRRHTIILPLPLRPDNLATRFFKAAGLDASVGMKIVPREAMNAVMLLKFARSDDGQLEPVSFEPKEIKNEHDE